MKKLLMFVLLILLAVFLYLFLNFKDDYKVILNDIDLEFDINDYSIFGQFMHINACNSSKNLDLNVLELVLKNDKEEINIPSEFYYDDKGVCFNLTDNGLYLDDLKKGKYLLLVKKKDKYYTFNNKTKYSNLEYYTITKNKKNNKITLNFGELFNKKYLELNIKKSKLPSNVYDITIDPGHGGRDTGAIYTYNGNEYHESDFTLKVSLLLKNELENMGYKVKLTRDSDIYLEPYGESGRAVIPNLTNSKYSFSLHMNSSDGNQRFGGVEVYIPNMNKVELAKNISDSLSEFVGYSKNLSYRIDDGVYYKYFTKSDIELAKNAAVEEELIPYDIKENIPYMFMIREIGGISTGAYIDGRNKILNKYFDSNKTAEPYLIEMAYINYDQDLDTTINNSENYASNIADAIHKYFTNISQK